MILVLTTEAGDYSHLCFVDWTNCYNVNPLHLIIDST